MASRVPIGEFSVPTFAVALVVLKVVSGEFEMVRNLVLLLGISEEASSAEVKKSYALLLQRLESLRIQQESSQKNTLLIVRERLSESYEKWKAAESRNFRKCIQQGCSHRSTARLGQVLVASGKISLACLMEILNVQSQSSPHPRRLGELLVEHGLLTEEELIHFLKEQKVISLPAEHPLRWGQRLVELGLVSEDQLQIALIDHTQTGCSLRQAFIDRGWLNERTLDQIF